MSQGLPRAAGALLAAGLGLSALAVFFGDGSAYAPLVWIGGAAVVTAGVVVGLGLMGRLALPRLEPAGLAFFALLAGFMVWNGVSIAWSVWPDRSWEYFNRGVVYFAIAVLGAFVGAVVPRAPRLVALGLLAVFGAALCWALLGKVIPNLYPDGERAARLRAPLEYWNALALVAAMTIVLALWAIARREHARWLRVSSVVLVFLAALALLLTYSRGGVVVALVGVAGFLVVARERVDAIAALGVSLPPAVVVGAWAFTQPGLAENGQPYDTRLADGLQLGLALVLGCALVAAVAYLGLEHEERWRQRLAPAVTGRRLAAFSAAALLVGVLAVSRGNPIDWARDGFREFTSPASEAAGPERLGDLSSNSRWTWWGEAWELFADDPVRGTGAGSFAMARKPIRRDTTVASEPHNVGLQFLSETGVVGFLLFAGSVGAAVVGVRRAIRRLDEADAAAASALAVLCLAYVLHAVIDYDWDFVGVSAPIALVLGLLVAAGRPAVVRSRQPLYAAGVALAAIAFVGSLAAPWLSRREVESAYAALERGEGDEAVQIASRARQFNPLAIEPLHAEAAAEEARDRRAAALDRYVQAVELQPRNAATWFELGRFELGVGLQDAGLRHLRRSRELDPWGPARQLLEQLGQP